MLSQYTKDVVALMRKYGVIASDSDINIFDDIFEEHTIRSIKLYTEHEYEEFKQDLIVRKNVEMDLNGSHKGKVQVTFTKVGDVDYGIDERQHLLDGEGNAYIIMDYQKETDFDPYEMVITVLETKEWDTKGIEYKSNVMNVYKDLYIYIPPIEEFDDNFDDDIDTVVEEEEDISMEQAIIDQIKKKNMEVEIEEVIGDVVEEDDDIDPVVVIDDEFDSSIQSEPDDIDPSIDDEIHSTDISSELLPEESIEPIVEEEEDIYHSVILEFTVDYDPNDNLAVFARRQDDGELVHRTRMKSDMLSTIKNYNDTYPTRDVYFLSQDMDEAFTHLENSETYEKEEIVEVEEDLSKEPVVLFFEVIEGDKPSVSAKRMYEADHDVDDVEVFNFATKSAMVKKIEETNENDEKHEYSYDEDAIKEAFRKLAKVKKANKNKEKEVTEEVKDVEKPKITTNKRGRKVTEGNGIIKDESVSSSDAKVEFRQLVASKVIDSFMTKALRSSNFELELFKEIAHEPIDEWIHGEESWIELIDKSKYMSQALQMIKDKQSKNTGRRRRR